MSEPIKESISLPKPLFDQLEILAQQLHISPNQLFEKAIERFIREAKDQVEEPPTLTSEERVINQGDVYWVQLNDMNGEEAGIPHPYVVVQDNLFNHSRIHTVVICALTSNIKRASLPGNIVLDAGEANLPKPSVVEVSKVSSVDKEQLGNYIGSLSDERIKQVLAGMGFVQRSYFEG
jgi:mRNA interferase MazF